MADIAITYVAQKRWREERKREGKTGRNCRYEKLSLVFCRIKSSRRSAGFAVQMSMAIGCVAFMP